MVPWGIDTALPEAGIRCLPTGDRARLLPIGETRSIRIVSPRAFLETFG
jgi:hypothetical protein